MKRREFLFKAAEAAALALFGGMGLAEVTKAVVMELQHRDAANQIVSQVAKHLNVPQRVEKCMSGKNSLVKDIRKGLIAVGLIVK